MKSKPCELCNQEASLYCASDSAFLCWNCDATVHHANFLVARHLRQLLCSNCNRFTGDHVSGDAPRRVASTCRSCSPEIHPDDAGSLASHSSLSSSACVSSSESRAATSKKIRDKRVRVGSCSSSVTEEACSVERKRQRRSGGSGDSVAEELFVKWSGELGLEVKSKCVMSLASHALGFCVRKWERVPFRVAAATSFWLGMRFCGDGRCLATLQNLWRLEAISGVPAKLILTAHARLARVFAHRPELQEGCDES